MKANTMTEVKNEALEALTETYATMLAHGHPMNRHQSTPEQIKGWAAIYAEDGIEFMERLKERGFTIAPIAQPVADEKLRGAVALLNPLFTLSQGWTAHTKAWDAIKAALAELAELRAAVSSYVSTVATCKRNNTPEWMDYIVERTNELLPLIGEKDRLKINRYGAITVETPPATGGV